MKVACVAVALVQLASTQVTLAGSDAPQRPCSIEGLRARVSSRVHIDSAAYVPGKPDVPAHCAAQGFIEHGTRVGFAVALPDEWNRKFLFLGIGGFGGVLEPLQSGLVRGYATVTTDTGHQGASLEDATWALNNSPASSITTRPASSSPRRHSRHSRLRTMALRRAGAISKDAPRAGVRDSSKRSATPARSTASLPPRPPGTTRNCCRAFSRTASRS